MGQGAAPDHRDWIGRSWTRSDQVSDRLIAECRATLPGLLGPGAVPPGLHWALAPDLAGPEALGRDGHPRQGPPRRWPVRPGR